MESSPSAPLTARFLALAHEAESTVLLAYYQKRTFLAFPNMQRVALRLSEKLYSGGVKIKLKLEEKPNEIRELGRAG